MRVLETPLVILSVPAGAIEGREGQVALKVSCRASCFPGGEPTVSLSSPS